MIPAGAMYMYGVPGKVNAALERLLPSGESVHLGVAVSGGPDSVALLATLVTLASQRALSLTVLHVNHALRPEADQEQGMVESLCQRWQIPCVVETLRPPSVQRGIEAWARTERYRFFRDARERYNLDYVALAHTMDDQAETVLFRLLRGSARRGLAGIPPIREGWIIRPLLGCTRREVVSYLTAHHLPSATDASNADVRYSRNRIRHLLLPFLEQEFSPHVRYRLATLAETLRAEEEWLEALASKSRERVQDAPLVLSLPRLAAEPAALRSRILRQWLEQSGQTRDIGFHHLVRVQALSEGHLQGKIALPGRLCVRRVGDRLLLEAKQTRSTRASPYCYTLAPGQEIAISEAGWHVAMTSPLRWSGPLARARTTNPWEAFFDVAALSDTVIVRNFRVGDRIRPLGMKGHKKVHDIFVDMKIPRAHRLLLPLVLVGEEVAWVVGCVRGEKGKVTATTDWVCRIEVRRLPEKQKLC